MDEPMSIQTEETQNSVQICYEDPSPSDPKFLSAPQDTLFRNLSIPVPALTSTTSSNSDMNLVDFAPQDTAISKPLDLSLATRNIDESKNHAVAGRFPIHNSAFLNAPRDTLFKNLPIPVPALPSTSSSSPAMNLFNFSPKDTAISVPEDLSLATGTIDESNSRVAVRFLVKKSKRFCGAIRFYLSKSAAANSSKFKSLMSTLKDSVKSTLASGVPSSQTISSLVSTLKGQKLPNCLRFLSFSLTSIKPRSKRSRSQEKSGKSGSSSSSRKSKTFLNWWKKPEPEPEGAHQFTKPKVYECSYCETNFFKLPVYLKHIRRHTQLIRCEKCSKAFTTLINKRRHQLQCSRRAIL